MWTRFGSVGRRKFCFTAMVFLHTLFQQTLSVVPQENIWERQSTSDNWVDGPPSNIPRVKKLEVVCGKTRMTVTMEFDRPFNGLVFSKGKHSEANCVYVQSNSNRVHYIFDVFYDACGTKPDLHGNFYENTVIIQQGSDIIEAWDEAKRLRCEWHEAYEKAAAQPPPIRLADLDVVELNFQGDNIDCWMEIQEGKGPWSREVSGLVPLGSPLTMVIAINDQEGQFDMRVKSCFAHDGHKAPIQLTDEWGCVTRPKMLSPFMKVRDYNGRASVVSYSHFFAFKFPDTMDVHIQCKVEVCRHGCPDSCQKSKYKPLDIPVGSPSSGLKKPELDHNELNVGHESKIVTVKSGTSKYKTHSSSSSSSYLPRPQSYAHHPNHNHHYNEAEGNDYIPLAPVRNEALSHDYVPLPPVRNEALSHDYLPLPPVRQKEASAVKYVASEIKSNDGTSGIKLTAAKEEDLVDSKGTVVEHLEEEPIPRPEHTPKPDIVKEPARQDLTRDNGDHHKAESVKSFHIYNENDEADERFKNSQDSSTKYQDHDRHHDINQDHDHHLDKNQDHEYHRDRNQDHEHHHDKSQHNYGTEIKHKHHHSGSDIAAGKLTESKDNFHLHPSPEPEPSFSPMLNVPSRHKPSPAPSSHKVEFPSQGSFESSSINREVYALGKNPRLEDGDEQRNQQPRGPVPPSLGVNLFQQQGPHQQDKTLGRQRFIPPVLYKPPKPHYPYPIPQFVPPQPLFINVAERQDKNVGPPGLQQPGHQQQFHDGHPQIELRNYQGPNGAFPPGPHTKFVQFPQGPRAIRMRRSAADGQEIGVSQIYRAVASMDLAFEPNATSDKEPIYSGRREEIIYGVCLPVAGFAVGLGFLLIITIGSLIVCAYLVYQWRLHLLKETGKNAFGGLTAKIKNGKLEFFYARGTPSRKS